MSEADFSFAFARYLKRTDLGDFPRISAVYREIRGYQGVPDVITIHGSRPSATRMRAMKMVLTHAGRNSLPILGLLSTEHAHTRQYVARRLGINEATLVTKLRTLEQLGVIKRTLRGSFLLQAGYTLPAFELWAYELKLSNWKRALFQTVQARAFVDRAFAVFPIEKEHLLMSNLGSFKRMNVGLLLFDVEQQTHKLIVRPQRKSRGIETAKMYTLAQLAAS